MHKTQKQNLHQSTKAKTIKIAMNSHHQTTDITEKSETHVFKILNIANTICGENYESLGVQVSL